MSTTEFNNLVLAQETVMKPFAIRLTKSPEQAKDLCQETMYKAFANREKFQPGTNIKAWLCTIMHNIFITDFQKKKLRQKANTFFRQQPTSFSANAESRLNHAEISSAIYRLHPALKQSFQLYLAGYKYEEIALVQGKPLGTIKGRIRSARMHLRSQLN